MEPNGSVNFKHYSSYKSQPKVLKLDLNFPPNGSHKTGFGIFEILSFGLLTIFFQIHHCNLWRNKKPQMSGKRAIIERNGMKFGTRG